MNKKRGGRVWFVGDLHFGHKKVAELRGFANTLEHDMTLERVWVRSVRPEDLVWVLGDISGGTSGSETVALDILGRLPGQKRLICGNHESISGIHRRLSPRVDKFREVFEHIADYGRIRIDGREFMLSHFPYRGDHTERERYAQYRLPDLGMPLIHAHTHQGHRVEGRQICVSWEAWGRLVSLEALLEVAKDIPSNERKWSDVNRVRSTSGPERQTSPHSGPEQAAPTPGPAKARAEKPAGVPMMGPEEVIANALKKEKLNDRR